MNKIQQFTFFKNYFEIIEELENENDKKDVIYAMVNFIFKDEEITFSGTKKLAWLGIKTGLETSKNRAWNAKIKTKSKQNQKEIKTKSKQNQKEIKTHSTSTSIIDNYIYLQDKGLLREKIKEWLEYKKERNETYKDRGLSGLLTELENNVNKYGEEKVINLITNCIANGYKGIIYEKLEKQGNSYQKQDIKKEQVPSWFNQEIKAEQLNENELKEIERKMSEFK